MMNLLFCGDIMPGGVLPYQDKYASLELMEYLRSFDYRIGTLETAIGTNLPFDSIKMAGRQNVIYTREEDFYRIKEMGFDVVSLANNHVGDLGRDGLTNTIKLLKESGIDYCGAGMNEEEASRPAVIQKDNCKIALLAYCEYEDIHWKTVPVASKNIPGVNPLRIEKVIEDIVACKSLYDFVIVLPHWGMEYTSKPMQKHVLMAKQMIDAGACAVLGSHPHQIQPTIKYRGGIICFSMGNLLFPDFFMQPPRPIWYPDKRELAVLSFEEVNDYPFPIEKPVKRVWKEFSRYGEIVNLVINKGRVTMNSQITYLSEQNILALASLNHQLSHIIHREKCLLQCRVVHHVSHVIKRVKRLFKSFFLNLQVFLRK